MPKQARAVATRAAIVASAGVVFARSSYSAATLADIYTEAGVTQGSLYFHFASKKELALAVIAEHHSLAISLAHRAALEGGGGIESVLHVTAGLATLFRTSPVVRAGLRLTTESAEVFVDDVDAPYVEWIVTAETFFAAAISAGDLVGDLTAFEYANVAIQGFTGTQTIARAVPGDLDIFGRLRLFWRVFLVANAPEERRASVLEAIERIVRA